MVTAFHRRTYSVGPFRSEVTGVVTDFKKVASTLDGIDSAFRERIMLAVTGVNDCRYCRFVHTRLARAAGITRSEADRILAGDFQDAPEEERGALEFARRWAERNAQEDPADKKLLIERYGQPKADQIEMCCRLIRIGNLSGNTLDSVLFKVSGGRLGA